MTLEALAPPAMMPFGNRPGTAVSDGRQTLYIVFYSYAVEDTKCSSGFILSSSVSDNRCSISTAQVLNGLATCNEDWVEMGGRCPVACDPGFVHRISTNDHVVCGGQNTWTTDYMGLSEMCGKWWL